MIRAQRRFHAFVWPLLGLVRRQDAGHADRVSRITEFIHRIEAYQDALKASGRGQR